ncbi:hypothetical protein ACFE04_006204 [Oxalis oulophora]
MAKEAAVFPCVLQITPKSVPYSSNPIVLRVDVLEGLLKVGTPICIPQIQFMDIGRVSSIQINHEPVEDAFQGERVDITIVGTNPQEEQIRFLTHFGMDDQLVSRISLRSFFILLDRHPHLSYPVLASLLRLMELFKLGDPTMRSRFCNKFFKGYEQKPLPRVLTFE